jgi:predicted metalloendopeptidase
MKFSTSKNKPGSVDEKIALFYKTGMDTVAIEMQVTIRLNRIYSRFKNIKLLSDIQDQISYFIAQMTPSAFGIGADADAKKQLDGYYLSWPGWISLTR